jgi:hypothetical protein
MLVAHLRNCTTTQVALFQTMAYLRCQSKVSRGGLRAVRSFSERGESGQACASGTLDGSGGFRCACAVSKHSSAAQIKVRAGPPSAKITRITGRGNSDLERGQNRGEFDESRRKSSRRSLTPGFSLRTDSPNSQRFTTPITTARFDAAVRPSNAQRDQSKANWGINGN